MRERVAGELQDRQETFPTLHCGRPPLLQVMGLAKKVLLANTAGEIWQDGFGDWNRKASGSHRLDRPCGVHLPDLFRFFRLFRYGDRPRPDVWFPLPGKTSAIPTPPPASRISGGAGISPWAPGSGNMSISWAGDRRGLGKQIRNILIVWLLTGIWHSAGWNTAVMGPLFRRDPDGGKNRPLRHWRRPVFSGITMLLVASWAILPSIPWGRAMQFIGALSAAEAVVGQTGVYLLYSQCRPAGAADRQHGAFPAAAFGNGRPGRPCRIYRGGDSALSWRGFVLCVAFLVDASYNPFLYFRFLGGIPVA